jgi:outer membrane protein W
MKKWVVGCIILVAVLLTVSNYASATDWRFPLGFTYANGFKDVVDIYKDNLKAKGYIVDTQYEWPVGLSFQPYVEFDNGLGFGIGIGPAMFILTSTDDDFFNLPVNMNLRFSFIPKADISPYIRGGVSYNLASSDFVEKSKLGLFGAVGIEFSRTKHMGFGLEVAYDASEIEFKKYYNSRSYSKENIKPSGFMASLFIIF